MKEIHYYEVEGAIFRQRSGVPLEIFNQKTGTFSRYQGSAGHVYSQSNEMTLEEVRPYMDVEPKDDDERAGSSEAA